MTVKQSKEAVPFRMSAENYLIGVIPSTFSGWEQEYGLLPPTPGMSASYAALHPHM